MIPLIKATANEPPTTPEIEGPTSGKAGVAHTYGLCSEDPDGDDITFCIDWGDDTPEEAGAVSESPFGPPGSADGAGGMIDGSHIYGDCGVSGYLYYYRYASCCRVQYGRVFACAPERDILIDCDR